MSRTSGYSFGILPEAAQVQWLASLPATDLAVAAPSGLLAYGKPATLIGMTLPNATTLRLSVAGDAPLRPGYLRDLTLGMGGALTLDMQASETSWRSTPAGFDLDVTIPNDGVVLGQSLVCQLTRARPDYLLDACRDRLDTYRGYQLWRWDYGSRIGDLIGTRAGARDVQRECEQAFAGIARAELEGVVVTPLDRFHFQARVQVAGGEEAIVDISP